MDSSVWNTANLRTQLNCLACIPISHNIIVSVGGGRGRGCLTNSHTHIPARIRPPPPCTHVAGTHNVGPLGARAQKLCSHPQTPYCHSHCCSSPRATRAVMRRSRNRTQSHAIARGSRSLTHARTQSHTHMHTLYSFSVFQHEGSDDFSGCVVPLPISRVRVCLCVTLKMRNRVWTAESSRRKCAHPSSK